MHSDEMMLGGEMTRYFNLSKTINAYRYVRRPPRAADAGNKDDVARHSAARVALWR